MLYIKLGGKFGGQVQWKHGRSTIGGVVPSVCYKHTSPLRFGGTIYAEKA